MDETHIFQCYNWWYIWYHTGFRRNKRHFLSIFILSLLKAQKSLNAVPLWIVSCSPYVPIHSGISCLPILPLKSPAKIILSIK